MKVQLLYFEGCPSWREAEARVTLALARLGEETSVERVRVADASVAVDPAFPGSPTLRVDGEDLFPWDDATLGLACRLYETPDGLAGSPTVEQLVEALSAARSSG